MASDGHRCMRYVATLNEIAKDFALVLGDVLAILVKNASEGAKHLARIHQSALHVLLNAPCPFLPLRKFGFNWPHHLPCWEILAREQKLSEQIDGCNVHMYASAEKVLLEGFFAN